MLKNKKILFIGPQFYDYHNKIIKEMENFGAKVTYYSEVQFDIKYRIAKKINTKLKKQFEKKYLNKILNEVSKEEYDIFLLIEGGIITPDFLIKLRNKCKKAYFVMYQWDSLENNNYLENIRYFNKVFTFDPVDSKKYNLEYLPLFFTKENGGGKRNKNYDIIFIGSFHGDRLKIIKKIIKECKKKGLKFYYYIYIEKLALFKFLFLGRISLFDLKYFSTKSLSDMQILKMYKGAKAVLDITNVRQNGLTIRTFEALALKLKLITTNKNILNESFYDKNNTQVINRNNPVLNINFFKTSFNERKKIKNYSINHWIKSLLTY